MIEYLLGGIKISYLSSFIVPFIVLLIILYSFRKIDVYDSFIQGSKDSIGMIKSLFPTMLAMILGVNIFLNSGLLDFLLHIFKPLFNLINIPYEIIPIAIIRPISGSASLAILNNLFNQFGPDSYIGLLSSVMQGSTDTTFYVITLYFGSVGIKKIKYALWAGLFADLVGIISSLIIVKIIF